MSDYSTLDKILIAITAIGNLGALIFGTGTLIYMIKINRNLSKNKKPRNKSKFFQK